MKIDLHCHSTNSDGDWTVKEILTEAEKKGIEALCITDHDTFAGSIEAHRLYRGVYSGKLLYGMEISAKVIGKSMHLLAYFNSVDLPEDHKLFTSLKKIKNSRIERMKEMIKKANNMGFNISFEDVLKEAAKGGKSNKQPTEVINRPHLAKALVTKGYVSSVNKAFEKYLYDDGPLYVKRFTLSLEEWIELIHELGGLAVWAHPLHKHKESYESLTKVGKIAISAGIDGMELIYDYPSKYPIKNDEFKSKGETFLWGLVDKHNLLVTCGGDFHGRSGSLGNLDIKREYWNRFIDKLEQ